MYRRGVRLHRSPNSATSSTTTESVPISPSDDPLIPETSDLRDLLAKGEGLHSKKDFATFVGIAESPRVPFSRDGQAQWKRVDRSPTFTLLTCANEVLALARLDASVEEVASILAATTTRLHTANMRGLYRDAFITGSVARNDHEVNQFLSVKTCCFVRSEMFGKNEQWCYAEKFHREFDGDSFNLTQISLAASSLPKGSATNDNSRRVAQLRGVTVAYLVERMPGSHGLRVVFHAIYNPAQVGDGELIVLRKAANARLRRLARGLSQLSKLVRCRRFGVQVLANHSAFDVRNPRCTCCTRKFTPFTKLSPRTRCYLCGYYVCVACSSSEKMEAQNGRFVSIMVCNRCVRTVDACNYEHMLTVLPGPTRALADESLISRTPTNYPIVSPSSRKSDLSTASTHSSSSQKLAESLGPVIDENSETIGLQRRRAARKVLEQLLTIGEDDTQTDTNKYVLSTFSQVCTEAMDISTCPVDPTACTFASSETRSYPTTPVLVQDEDDQNHPNEPVSYPIPANEDIRLAAIDHFSLHELVNIPELNVLCQLAAAEMTCPHSVITLVEREVVTILAANSSQDWDIGCGNPRGQTFCQHFVMDDQPLLVRHAEADMRFYHTGQVVYRGLRFYAGFPVSVSFETSNTKSSTVIVGALCCLDERPHQMTRSQYWRLKKLAQAASQILQRHADKHIATDKIEARADVANAVKTHTQREPTTASCA